MTLAVIIGFSGFSYPPDLQVCRTEIVVPPNPQCIDVVETSQVVDEYAYSLAAHRQYENADCNVEFSETRKRFNDIGCYKIKKQKISRPSIPILHEDPGLI